jgi:glucose-6-phosphate isomerase
MTQSKLELWERFQKYHADFPSIGLSTDISRVNFPDSFLAEIEAPMQRAFQAMDALEKGSIANPDEGRMVGHYWLRNPELAPNPAIKKEIQETIAAIKTFAAKVHAGTIRGAKGNFKNILLIGIGGSALGPQFVASALGHPAKDKLRIRFFDNTDPDGMERVLAGLAGELGQTLCVVISKSGGTMETRNGMLQAQAAWVAAGLNFGEHAVAITGTKSELDKIAVENKWLERFPMWDWVGGRTSELSAVGLLPAALQGIDIDAILSGARTCDAITRNRSILGNPAAALAAMIYKIGNGKGTKSMVVLPYKDRLELFSKYLQQLCMESLGKRLNLKGEVVNQGLTVFGNKGSTDQHSYIQQLRDGLNNFFVVFIEVLNDGNATGLFVEPGVTAGDYLEGFLLGTREALYASDRESMTLTIREVSPFSVGVLIALFERAVGLYAELIGINAYHQPGVEAGKKAASRIIELQGKANELLKKTGAPLNAGEIAKRIDSGEDVESVYKICEHLAANAEHQIGRAGGTTPADATFRFMAP